MKNRQAGKIHTKHITTTRSGRYYLLGRGRDAVEGIWFVLHGYGQPAEDFINGLQSLSAQGNLVVAPEGLHRFYLKGHSGRVGASWMTSDDREMDIRDNMVYLDHVFHQVTASLVTKPVPVNLLGFSQGVSTALRWAGQGAIAFDRIICWAGSVPPEPELGPLSPALRSSKMVLVFGDSDPFFDAESKRQIFNQLLNHRLQAQLVEFQGAHEIDQDVLKQIAFI